MVSLFVISSLPTVAAFARSRSLVPNAIPSTYTNSMIRFLQSKLAIGFRTRLTRYVHDLYLNDKATLLPHHQPRRSPRCRRSVHHHRHCTLLRDARRPLLERLQARARPRHLQLCSQSFSRTHGHPRPFHQLSLHRLDSAAGHSCLRQAGCQSKQKLEGDFRSAHSRLITNAEEIAFYNGASIEAGILNRAYIRLVRHIDSIFKIRIAFNMTKTLS